MTEDEPDEPINNPEIEYSVVKLTNIAMDEVQDVLAQCLHDEHKAGWRLVTYAPISFLNHPDRINLLITFERKSNNYHLR